MPVIMVEEFYVRQENRAMMKELRDRRNEILKGVKSLRSIETYMQSYGGMGDAFIEFLEFDSMSSIDEFGREAYALAEFASIAREMRRLIEPMSVTRKLWRRV